MPLDVSLVWPTAMNGGEKMRCRRRDTRYYGASLVISDALRIASAGLGVVGHARGCTGADGSGIAVAAGTESAELDA